MYETENGPAGLCGSSSVDGLRSRSIRLAEGSMSDRIPDSSTTPAPLPVDGAALAAIDLEGEQRERAVPVIKDGFEGIYRWHAKKTLRSAKWVRAIVLRDEVVAVSVLENLAPSVGYVYYLSTSLRHRREGLGGRLLDDALALFRRARLEVVYAAAEEDNAPSLALFRSRGFRTVERKELSYRDGGLGAWGLRSRMTLVWGEVLLGLRISRPSVRSLKGETAPVRSTD
jgi:ribosomal protein S18 acetylase RimI-like enzyme